MVRELEKARSIYAPLEQAIKLWKMEHQSQDLGAHQAGNQAEVPNDPG